MRRSPKSHRSYEKYQQSINSQLKEISNNLQKYISIISENAKDALDEIAEEVKDKSLEIAPEDTGELKNSIYIASELENEKYTIEIGYTAEHAVFAHENAGRKIDYKNPTTPGTHWQFLLAPAIEVENELEKRIFERIKKDLR